METITGDFTQLTKEWEAFKKTSLFKEIQLEATTRKSVVWDKEVVNEEDQVKRDREVGFIKGLDWVLTHFEDVIDDELKIKKMNDDKVVDKKEQIRLANLRKGR